MKQTTPEATNPASPVSLTLIQKLKHDGKQISGQEHQEYAPETIIEPLFKWEGAGHFLDSEPPPVQWLLKDLLPAGIVGAIFAAGGTGKTFLALHLACAMAANRNFGPFHPVKPLRVLYIGGEDPQDELHRRVRRVAESMDLMENFNLRRNLNAISLVGTDRVLIELQDGNPKVTTTYMRLQEAIRQAGEVDVVIIDPMSRFFGLNENDNTHATAWISCLERLAREHSTTVLFCHHESKATTKEGNVRTSTGRGASAIRDGVRWSLSLGEIGEKAAREHGINPAEYLEMYTSKSNYAARWPGTEFFRRRGDGTLEPASLRADRRSRQTDLLVELLANAGEDITRRDLQRGENGGKAIVEEMKETFPSFSARRDIPLILIRALEGGWVSEEGYGKRKSLQVGGSSRNTPLGQASVEGARQ